MNRQVSLSDLLVRTSDSGSCGQGQPECTPWWILSEALGALRGCAVAGACCWGGWVEGGPFDCPGSPGSCGLEMLPVRKEVLKCQGQKGPVKTQPLC